jgi:hypothetical protein
MVGSGCVRRYRCATTDARHDQVAPLQERVPDIGDSAELQAFQPKW